MVVTGLGQCCWDTLAEVEKYPSPDSKAESGHWVEQGGGPAATALVTVARLGLQCRFAGVVGDDAAGTLIRHALYAEGIDVAHLLTRPGAASQRAFIMVERPGGRRTIVWQRPTGAPLSPAELEEQFWSGSAFLHLDGLMEEASLHGAREARRRGIPVMVDAGRMRPGMRELAKLCDYLVAAEQFFLDLGWDGSGEQFARLADGLGAPVVTVTLGDRGSLTRHGGTTCHVPAFPVTTLDTTGAGDVFHGGYLFGLIKRWPLRETVVFASAAAALSCLHLGAQRGAPRLDEVIRFLVDRGIPVPAV
ncbi:sugar kinase [Geobacter sulfurreducens]|uniref:sugar kinase n=1 Tax=Geobacter sulfurreducens TaxID=35554 RepID=UPI000DBB6DE5|nr:sugar kinase [Geobacter sulfurreducens]BBA69228.1 Sulfofructose kinase [Geobacter sulfurreducens]